MTGRAVVLTALQRGMRVKALYRPGSEPKDAPAGLEILTGQLTSADDVRRTLEGTQAACCVFGLRLSQRDPPPAVFCAAATANVIAGMESLGISRLVCQTGAMAGSDTSNLGLFYRRLRRQYRRRFRQVAADRDAQERVVRNRRVDWLLVRPPYIRRGPPKGHLRAAPSMRVGFLSRAILGDLADFHCDELAGGRFHRQAMYVAG